MNRRDFLTSIAAAGFISRVALANDEKIGAPVKTITPAPFRKKIPVAFLISQEISIADFCAIWEVFESVWLPDGGAPFELYTVAKNLNPVRAKRLQITPDYDFVSAPEPEIIVIASQNDASQIALDWLKKSAKRAEIVIATGKGVFLLAESGLLEMQSVMSAEDFWENRSREFQDASLREKGKFAVAGGLTSAVNLSLEVVERYFGRETAEKAAFYLG